MSYSTLIVPVMNEPPRRHDITIRIATKPGPQPDPAAFAVTAAREAAARSAGVLTAHMAEEIICVVSVAAGTGPETAAIAMSVVAGALRAGEAELSPSRP
jgi:hypothetical protein